MLYKELGLKQIPPAKDKITDKTEISKMYTRGRRKMFISMYLGYTVFYFTRKNMTPALPLLSDKLEVDIVELGILSTVFYVVYGIGKFISGLLADRANIRTFMALGLFCASFIHLFFGFLNSLYLLIFFWGLNAAFQSMGFPPIAKGMVHWFSPRERATKWTIMSSSHTAGTFLIGVIVAGLLTLYHQGWVNWQSIFYVPGILGMVCSVFLLFNLLDRPVSLGLPEIEKYNNDVLPVKIIEKTMSHWQILKKHIFTNPYLWLLSIASTFIYVIRFGTLDWGTKFMYDVKGMDEISVAIFWTLMPLAGMPGGIIAGYIADRFYQGRCTPINLIYLTLLALSIAGFYFYAGPDHYILTGVFLLAMGFFVDGPQNLVSGVQASRVTVNEAMGTACGFGGLFSYIGAALSGVGLAYITKHFGWGAMYGSCVASCVITAILVSFTWKKEKTDRQNI